MANRMGARAVGGDGKDTDSVWVQISALDAITQAMRLRERADPDLATSDPKSKMIHYQVCNLDDIPENERFASLPLHLNQLFQFFDKKGKAAPEKFFSALGEIRHTVETRKQEVFDFCIATGGGKGKWEGKRFRLNNQQDADLDPSSQKLEKQAPGSQTSMGGPSGPLRQPSILRSFLGVNKVVPYPTDLKGISTQAAQKTFVGTFDFSKDQDTPCAHFVTVPVLPRAKGYTSRVDPHLLRFYFEQKLGLKHPKVLLSLTGGATDFEMTNEQKDKLLEGMTEVSKSVDAWFVTGGTDKGIMKFVGEVREKNAAHVPLIGIVTLSVLKGAEAFKASPENIKKTSRVDGTRTSCSCFQENGYDAEASQGKACLDGHHSHFILADDGDNHPFSFGKETRLRADFEAAVSTDESDKLGSINRILEKEGYGWEGMHKREDTPPDKVPVVCVCVQGGPGSIQTVCDALAAGTPALMVRGSGKAADLIADATSLQFAEGHCESSHVKYLQKDAMKKEQKMLLELLEYIDTYDFDPVEGEMQVQEQQDIEEEAHKAKEHHQHEQFQDEDSEKTPEDEAVWWNYEKVMKWFKFQERHHKANPVQHKCSPSYELVGEGGCTCKSNLRIDAKCELLEEGFRMFQGKELQDVMREYDLPATDAGVASGLMGQALTAAYSGKCWVYDLDDHQDPDATKFDESLLHCLLHGLGYESNSDELWKKLELTIRWKRQDVMERVLERTWVKGEKKKRAIQKALHLAMTLDRVECVHLLFECGADPEELYHYPSKQVAAQDRHANPSLDGVVIDTAEEPPKKGWRGRRTSNNSKNKPGNTNAGKQGSAKELEDELKTAASCKEQIKRWSELFKSSKLIKTESHVQAFKTDVKNEWRGWRLFSYKQMFWKNSYTAEDLAEGYKAGSTTKEKLGIIYDFKRDQVKNTSSSSESAKEKSSNAKSSHANGSKDNNGKDKGSQGSKKKSSNDKGEEDGTEEEAHDDSMDSSEKKKLKDEETQSAKHKMSVLLLLAIYKDVLGDDFKYDLGVLGDCYLDLFFLMVLMNRVEMAKMLWQRAKFPVMSALTACALLRGMAGRSDVEPVTRNKMTMSAQEFENMAIGVQNVALDKDIQLAVKSLEQPRKIWGGLTNTDLAVRSQCQCFVEECCKEAIDRRFAGDLMPYDQSLPIFSKHKSLTICTVTWLLFPIPFLGVLAPFFMNFNAPPVSDEFRPPTQHRKTPLGYPNDPQENPRWRRSLRLDDDIDEHAVPAITKEQASPSDKSRHDSSGKSKGGHTIGKREERPPERGDGGVRSQGQGQHRSSSCWRGLAAVLKLLDGPRRDGNKRDAKKVMEKIKSVENLFSDYSRNKLWYPTFRYRDRWYCFYRAPIAVFIFHSVWYFIVAVVFTYFVVETASPMEWNYTREQRSLTENMHPMEVFMSAVFGGKFLTEMLQLFIQGPTEYMSELWNTFDMLMILGYYCGLAVRLYCFNGVCKDFRIIGLIGVNPEDLYLQLYCISLCFLWISQLRVLSVHRTIGPLVLIFLNMCSDVANFFFMLFFFLMAFSVLIFGSGVTNGNAWVDDEGSKQCQEAGGMYAACNTWWWFTRTVLQSFGEFYVEEMTTGISIVWLIILFGVVNLILFNLLIALMSHTFERIQKESERQWMINHYNSTNEYLRFAMALPSPLNVPGIFFELATFLLWFMNPEKRAVLRREFCGFTWQRSVAIFLSRNRNLFENELSDKAKRRPELSSSQSERRKKVQLATFMEDSRKVYNLKIKEEEARSGSSLLSADHLIRKNHHEIKNQISRKTGEVLNQQKAHELRLESQHKGKESKLEDLDRRFKPSLKPLPPIAPRARMGEAPV